MYIIAGLGNPGEKYAQTRHNMGFMTIDYLANELGVTVNKIKHKALVGDVNISGHKVMLVKPQTFMNLSGEAIREIMNYYKVEHEHLIIVYDDLDIEIGNIRIRKKGSAGTHNGMRSVVGQLGYDDFPRIRIGIGGNKKKDIIDFVIGGFDKNEKEPLEKAVIQSSKALKAIVTDGIEKAMNKYNGSC